MSSFMLVPILIILLVFVMSILQIQKNKEKKPKTKEQESSSPRTLDLIVRIGIFLSAVPIMSHSGMEPIPALIVTVIYIAFANLVYSGIKGLVEKRVFTTRRIKNIGPVVAAASKEVKNIIEEKRENHAREAKSHTRKQAQDEILRYKEMIDKGIITQEQYEKKFDELKDDFL